MKKIDVARFVSPSGVVRCAGVRSGEGEELLRAPMREVTSTTFVP